MHATDLHWLQRGAEVMTLVPDSVNNGHVMSGNNGGIKMTLVTIFHTVELSTNSTGTSLYYLPELSYTVHLFVMSQRALRARDSDSNLIQVFVLSSWSCLVFLHLTQNTLRFQESLSVIRPGALWVAANRGLITLFLGALQSMNVESSIKNKDRKGIHKPGPVSLRAH